MSCVLHLVTNLFQDFLPKWVTEEYLSTLHDSKEVSIQLLCIVFNIMHQCMLRRGGWGCNIQITSLIRIKALTSLNIQTNIVIYSTLLTENIMQYNLLSAGFPMDTNCAPLLDDPIFIVSEAEFFPKLLHEKKILICGL